MVKNRSKRARERAGLSLGQAAEKLGVERDRLQLGEEKDAVFDTLPIDKLADVYGVNVEWLRGDAERCNYEAMKDVRGWDELSFRDKETIAEFAASLPPAKPCKTCGKVGCHPFRHAGWDPTKDEE